MCFDFSIQVMPNAEDICGGGSLAPIAPPYYYSQGSRAGLIPPEYGDAPGGALPGCRQFADANGYGWAHNSWTSNSIPAGCYLNGNAVIFN